MDYDAYFRDLADYYTNSRIPSKVMTGAAELRAGELRGRVGPTFILPVLDHF